ncbi:MAG TPA: adenylate kinase [Acidimicrobiales bacterium]|nr:adenylate kinase [Acidimicrobiales bacterium]
MGRQGAGKGTQCERLSHHYGIPHISTGDMLRSAVAAGTELGRRAKAIMEAGDLVPDSLMQEIVAERLSQPDAAQGFLLDGFPRTEAQAQFLDDYLAPRALDLVINIEVPDEVVIARMLARGRADDTEEAICRRLELYEKETAPLIHFYRDKGILVSVDGYGSPDEVEQRLIEVIDSHVS